MSHYRPVLTALENGHDPHPCQSQETSPGIAFRYQYRHPSKHYQHNYRLPLACIWQERPNGRSRPYIMVLMHILTNTWILRRKRQGIKPSRNLKTESSVLVLLTISIFRNLRSIKENHRIFRHSGLDPESMLFSYILDAGSSPAWR